MVSHPALIAIDIDGTLLPSDAVDISVRNRRALEAATAAGIEIKPDLTSFGLLVVAD